MCHAATQEVNLAATAVGLLLKSSWSFLVNPFFSILHNPILSFKQCIDIVAVGKECERESFCRYHQNNMRIMVNEYELNGTVAS